MSRQSEAATRAPDFFIVGQPKCGTTALYEMLRRHPQIYMPELKEPRFFARELQPAARRGDARSRAPQTLEEYLALFAPARPEQRAGEASPSVPVVAAPPRARIAALQPARADHRDPARAGELPALAAPAAAADPRRDGGGSAQGARARGRGAGAAADPARHPRPRRCSTPSTCATSSSCAATTRCSDRSRCWC